MGLSWRKPDPRGFELLLDRLDCRPEEAVYIADNPAKDFAAPMLLGMGAVRIWRPCGRHWRLDAATPETGPQLEVGSLLEIPAALEILHSWNNNAPRVATA